MSSPRIHTDTMATRPASAKVILDQIGPRVLMSIGARDTLDLGDGVQMAVSRGRRKLIIKLAANNTYTLERVRLRDDFSVVSEALSENIHADNLPAAALWLGDV